MTNQEKFVEVFGKDMLNKIVEDANVDILRWLFGEYENERVEADVIKIDYDNRPAEYISLADAIEKVEEQPVVKKRGHRKGVRHYNTTWYEEAVEDFYCSSERLKTFKVEDDQTPVKCKSLDSLKGRFQSAIEALGVSDCVQVHKYYRGTCNECIALENISKPKNKNLSYKLS